MRRENETEIDGEEELNPERFLFITEYMSYPK
jgi:hypothetical protein